MDRIPRGTVSPCSCRCKVLFCAARAADQGYARRHGRSCATRFPIWGHECKQKFNGGASRGRRRGGLGLRVAASRSTRGFLAGSWHPRYLQNPLGAASCAKDPQGWCVLDVSLARGPAGSSPPPSPALRSECQRFVARRTSTASLSICCRSDDQAACQTR